MQPLLLSAPHPTTPASSRKPGVHLSPRAQIPKGSGNYLGKWDYSPERSLLLTPEESGVSGDRLHTSHYEATAR